MELREDLCTLGTVAKPRSLQMLDQAYDSSSFKFSQIIRYLQDQYSYHQDLTLAEPYHPDSTSPLPVDPKIAYDIHTGKYARQFKTQGATIVGHHPQGVLRLPYPSKLYERQPTGIKLPKARASNANPVCVSKVAVRGTAPELHSSHNSLRRHVWRLPAHASAAFGKGNYKPPLKLPPITVPKLMNGF